MRVFITGGSGLIGRLLVKRLRERGDDVVLLLRRPESAPPADGQHVTVIFGDAVQPGPWMDALSDCDAVVHLAGQGIFNQRWNQEFKDLIYSSRVKSTENIVAAIGKDPVAAGTTPRLRLNENETETSLGKEPATNVRRVRVLINASAMGIYGPHGDEQLTESALVGNDFLAEVCIDWEKAAQAVTSYGVRVVLLRTGIVLDKSGGALAQMLTPFKMFVGGKVGSGAQWMSWIHNEDEVGLILFALDHPEVNGPLNATAPNPVTNREFAKTLGKVLGRPSFFPTPTFMLKLMLGQAAEIVTTGQRVLPKKSLDAGFVFKFPSLETALRDVLG